jgi:hypothetical protein
MEEMEGYKIFLCRITLLAYVSLLNILITSYLWQCVKDVGVHEDETTILLSYPGSKK